MTSLFDKLNLRPAERRLVVIVGSVVFVVLNLWLVLPHFGDLGRIQQRTRDAQNTLNRFQAEIKMEPEYRREQARLAALGALVAEDARALELQKEVSSQAALSGIAVSRYDSGPRSTTSKTNAFFDEAGLMITFTSGEKELVDFLYNLAERNSLIRVRSMDLKPDMQRYRLGGSITLVASYQKKPPPPPPKVTTAAPAAAKPAASLPATATPPAKSATPPAKATPPPAAPSAKPAGHSLPKGTAAKDKAAKTPAPPTPPSESPRLINVPKRSPPPTPK